MNYENMSDMEIAKRFFYPKLVRKMEESNGRMGLADKFLLRKAMDSYLDVELERVGLEYIFDRSYYNTCYKSGLEGFGFNPPSNE